MELTTAQRDRACGVLLATAAGDALGAPYEFHPPRGPELEVAMVGGGGFGWEPGEWTDGVGAPRSLPDGVDAIVSLCRMPEDDLPRGVEQVDVRLIDSTDPANNTNLDFMLLDTVRLIEQLRHEGRTVLLHCVQAERRTPAVAALYGARKSGVDVEQAFRDVCAVLPGARPNQSFRDALGRVHPPTQ